MTMHSGLEYWLWLTIAFRPSNPRKWSFLQSYSSVEEGCLAAMSGDMRHVAVEDRKSVAEASWEAVDKIIEYCRKKSINIYSIADEDYPQRLKSVYNPPSVLFCKGDITKIKSSVIISEAGTRRPSEYSEFVTKTLCTRLAKSGAVIATGLADGLDTLAIKSALSAGGKAIAVLPCGIECDSTDGSKALKDTIAAHGAVISEYLPEERVSRLNFRSRNRILSGLSMGVLITQAGEKSGALSLASFALAQDRDVFCIPPHRLFDNDYSGASRLIRDGAIPVFDAEDIIGCYAHLTDRFGHVRTEFEPKDSYEENISRTFAKNKPAVETVKSGVPSSVSTAGMSDEKKKIIEFISRGSGALFDEISTAFPDIEDLELVISELEFDGVISSEPGNRYMAAPHN